MKKHLLSLILLTLVSVGLAAQGGNVSIDVSGKSLETVLNDITAQSGVVFSYERKLADTPIKVKGSRNGTLPSVLDWLFDGTGIEWKEISSERIALSCKSLPSASARPQKTQRIRIGGRVTDKTGLPVVGAAVIVRGSSEGTITDMDGNWTLDVPENGVTLDITSLGYRTVSIVPEKDKSYETVLQDDDKYLEEAVVVGYGQQKRATMTGSVAQVNSTELKKAPAANLSTLLAGKLPGLVTKQSSGQPGADGASMYVRGIGAGDGQMLVVVDGVIRSFPDLNPDEIETISILKDATSAAAYGVRASAGVMLITTKKGMKQKPTVNFNSSLSLSRNTMFPEFLDGPEYAYWYNKAQELDGVIMENRRFTEEEIERITNGDPEGIYGNTDWFSLIFKKVAPIYNNSVSLSGGTDNFKYFASVGAYNQQGIVDRTSYDRYNTRINFEAKVTDNFSINFGMSGRLSSAKSPGLSTGIGNSYASVFQQAMLMYPYLPQEYDGLPVGSMNSAGNGNQNPLAARDLSGQTTTDASTLQTNATIKYDIPFVKGMSFKLDASYDIGYQTKKIAQLAYKLNVWNQNTRSWSQSWARHLSNGESQVNEWKVSSYSWMLRPTLTYTGSFGEHNIDALVLYEFSQNGSESLSAGMRGYEITDIMDITFGQTIIESLVNGGHSMDKRSGVVGRFNYNYAEKYLFEMTVRADATPYLPAEYRWGLFPGVSVGWRISEEDFFYDAKELVDNLKIRLSAGRLGSDRSLGYSYSYLSTMSQGSDPVVMIGGKPSYYISPSSPANTALRWQTSDTYNIGVDARLWKGLLGVELDAFYSITRNKLEAQSGIFPPSMGSYYPTYVNYGSHDNRGFELVLTHENHVSDLHYNIRGNLSWARNKILKMTENPNIPSYMKEVGCPMGQYYGFQALGLFQSEEEIKKSALYGPTLPGDIKLLDKNKDGRITWGQDRTVIGRSSTPEMVFGLNMNFYWKGFDLDIFFQGAALCDIPLCGCYRDRDGIYDNTFYTKPFAFDGNTPKYLVENSWTPEHTDALYPRLRIEERANGGKMSSWWIVDGSYLRLKSLQVGYSIPEKVLRNINLETVRFYLAGGNLFTLSHLPYLDPEMPDVNQGYYPQQMTFELGVNLKF